MPFEQRDMGGALFKNTRKQGKQPDYKGGCVIDGHKYEIGAWLNETKSGGRYLSLVFSEPWSKGESANTQDALDEGDDVPF